MKNTNLLLQTISSLHVAGNTQLRNLASEGSYHDGKEYLPPADKPLIVMPSEHCQSPLRYLERNLDHQHQSLRQRKLYRYSRNPIVSSPQYQAYRARQSRDGNQEDAKWPEILEAAFLDGNSPPLRMLHFTNKYLSSNRHTRNGSKEVLL